RHITDPMRLVLNVPLPPHHVQPTPGCRPLGGQTGASIDHFSPFLPRLLDDDVTPPLTDLRPTGPMTVTHQSRTGREIALLDAPMADVPRASGLLTVARRRARKDPLDSGPQRRLMRFADHARIASLVHNGLGHVPLGEPRLHRAPPVLQDDLA